MIHGKFTSSDDYFKKDTRVGMLILPKKMVELGYVKSRQEGWSLESNQFQQIGLDVRVCKIQRIVGTATIMRFEKQLPSYVDIDRNQDECWFLTPGVYALECMEECQIPQGFEGKLIHRSTFNRSGCFITGSVYDPGYKGIIAGTMYSHINMLVEFGTRIAQFQMQTAEMGELYDGDYQNQSSHAEVMGKVNGQSEN